MWRDKLHLKRLKEQTKTKDGVDVAKQRQTQEQMRRKKMPTAQDGILKYILKMMEVCKDQGFVYGIIPEKGKPVTGAGGFLPEEGHGVYVTRWCHGSPAHRYGLYALQWIVEVNGKPTPDLDVFVKVTQKEIMDICLEFVTV